MSRFEAPQTPPRPIPVPQSPPRLRPLVRGPKAFLYFGLLPTEIRLKIWAFALPQARLVHVVYDSFSNRFTEESAPAETPLVNVNVEAREMVFEHYASYFGTPFQHALIYADIKIDIISINYQAFEFRMVGDREFRNLRYLEISDHHLYMITSIEIIHLLSNMPRLEQLTVLDPRSPYKLRPLPPLPANSDNLQVNIAFYRGLRDYNLGRLLESNYEKVWKWLVKVDLASRLSQYGLSNFGTGIVGYTTDGERQWKMVCDADHGVERADHGVENADDAVENEVE